MTPVFESPASAGANIQEFVKEIWHARNHRISPRLSKPKTPVPAQLQSDCPASETQACTRANTTKAAKTESGRGGWTQTSVASSPRQATFAKHAAGGADSQGRATEPRKDLALFARLSNCSPRVSYTQLRNPPIKKLATPRSMMPGAPHMRQVLL